MRSPKHFFDARWIIIAVLLAGCSVSTSEVEAQFQAFMGSSFAGEFTIESSSYGVSLSDSAATVQVRFTDAGYKHLWSMLKPEEYYHFSRTHPYGSGYDYFTLDVPLKPTDTARLQFGNE